MPEEGDSTDWVKRADRDPVSVAASLALAGRHLPVLVTDVSEDGCRITCEETLPIGSAVSITVDLVTVAATIRWSFAGSAGLLFLRQQMPE